MRERKKNRRIPAADIGMKTCEQKNNTLQCQGAFWPRNVYVITDNRIGTCHSQFRRLIKVRRKKFLRSTSNREIIENTRPRNSLLLFLLSDVFSYLLNFRVHSLCWYWYLLTSKNVIYVLYPFLATYAI